MVEGDDEDERRAELEQLRREEDLRSQELAERFPEYPYRILELFGDEPVPYLQRIPEDRWRDALAPLSFAAQRAAGLRGGRAATMLVMEMRYCEGGADAVRDAAPVVLRGAPPREPGRGAGRQVGFRLGPTEHERLAQAARLHGVRPATLARMLTVRGVEAALREADRAGASPAAGR